MTRNIAVPASIREQGLDNYLNDTAPQHNGYGYRDFSKMLGSGLGPAAMARVFGVSRQTAHKWFKIHKELANK